MSRSLKAAALAVALLLCAGLTAADSHAEPNIYVWINFVTAQPGQGDALVGELMKDAQFLDPLVESGKALEWGIAMPATHFGGDSELRAQWVTFVGWDGADHFMSSFMATMQSKSAEEQKANRDHWTSIVEPGSHRDEINLAAHTGITGPTSPTYIHLSYVNVQPGADLVAVYKEHFAPIYDAAVASGAIQNYGLQVPAIHSSEGWDGMNWYMSATLAARDGIRAAFDAAEAARSDEENKAWWDAATSTFEDAHDDQILVVVHHKTPSTGGE